MDSDLTQPGTTTEGAIADVEDPRRDPVIASYAVRIVLRAPDGTPAPTLEELSDKLAAGLGWGYVSTIEGERTDR